MAGQPLRAAARGAEGPRSILRVLQIFSTLAAEPQGMSLSRLAHAMSVPKTTLHTMLRVLESARYLVADDDGYKLGPEAVVLGAAMASAPRQVFPDCALGVLKGVTRRTGETGFLAVLTDDRRSCRYVAAVEAENWLRFSVEVGSLKPAYATGSGQAMLAYLSDDELAAALDGVAFARVTSRTVSSRSALLRALAEVRRKGVSTVDSGTVAGVLSVAAPIMDSDGRVVAAITVGGPAARLAEQLDQLQAIVADGARQVSQMLGYSGPWPPARAEPAAASHSPMASTRR